MIQYRPVYSTVHQKAVEEWNRLPDTIRQLPWMVSKAESEIVKRKCEKCQIVIKYRE
jgi:hypothetical protein